MKNIKLRRMKFLLSVIVLLILFSVKWNTHVHSLSVDRTLSLKLATTAEGSIKITGNTELSSHKDSGSGTKEDPYVIENREISYSATSTADCGISITGTSEYFIIRNCIITELDLTVKGIGVYLNNVAPKTATLLNNSIDMAGVGIWIFSSPAVNVSKNNIGSGNSGIIIGSSRSCVISENLIAQSGNVGISITTSDCVRIVKNTIDKFTTGIGTVFSQKLLIKQNQISGNEQGIELFNYTSNSLIICNQIEQNTNYGVYIGGAPCENNTVYMNNFIENNKDGTSQAYDEGINNKWDDTHLHYISIEGNYWHCDWSGDADYLIDGPAHSVDTVPLLAPVDIDKCMCECQEVVIIQSTPGLLGIFTLPILLFLTMKGKRRKQQ